MLRVGAHRNAGAGQGVGARTKMQNFPLDSVLAHKRVVRDPGGQESKARPRLLRLGQDAGLS